MKKRIGIIDSGIGGLTLLWGLYEDGLDLEYFYCSDNKNVPYGEKSQNFMLNRVIKMVDSLISKNVDAILLACNTLTAHTIDLLRDKYCLPFIGIEPYINFSNLKGQENSSLNLILTQATFESERFQKLRELKDPNKDIDIFVLKNLALIIESSEGQYKNHLDKLSKEFIEIKKKNYTHCILGCTHYPFIKEYIARLLSVKVVDPTSNVVKEVRRVLEVKESNQLSEEFDYSVDCGTKWNKTSFNYIKSLYFK